MKVKGSAVKTVPDFVKNKFQEKYDEWVECLPHASQEIMRNPVYATNWYEVDDAIIKPMEVFAKIVNKDLFQLAKEMGKFSADIALTGIYKVFVRITSPTFVINKASNILTTYYQPCDIKVVTKKSNSIELRLELFSVAHELIMYRIAGWSQRTFEVIGSKNVVTNVTKVMNGNAPVFFISINWE